MPVNSVSLWTFIFTPLAKFDGTKLLLLAPIVSIEDASSCCPIPTLPLADTCNIELPLEEATTKIGRVGNVDVPWTTKVALGVEEPMPKLPLAFIIAKVMPVEEAILN